jgi:hypothetical protein
MNKVKIIKSISSRWYIHTNARTGFNSAWWQYTLLLSCNSRTGQQKNEGVKEDIG